MEVSSLYKSSSYRSRKKTSAVNSIIPVDKRRLSKKPEKYVSQTEELSDKSDKQEGELSDKSEELSEKSYKHEEELSEKSDKLEEEELSEKSEEELIEESRVDSKYYELAGKAVFYLKVPDEVIDNWFGGGNGNRSLFICLDISASMGDAMTQAKEAILQIIEGLVEKGIFAEKDITCFFFNKSCRETRFGDDPNLLLANGEIRRYFDEVNAGGGTDFSVVFRSITKNLDRIKNNLSIIFFTDGQNNAGELEEAKVELKNGLTGFPYTTEIHSVGFTREHDARLLSWLTNCGSKNGNFIYVKSSEEILEKMKTTLNLLEINTPTLYVKVDGELLRADLDEEGNAMFVLPNDSANKQITILKDLEGQEKFESQPVQIHADDPLAAKITTKYIQREVVRLMSEISDLKDNVTDKQETFDKILAKVAMFENQFETFSQIVSEDITKYMASTKSRLDKFKVIVTEAKKGNLTNEAIAIFNDGLYKDITPQGLSKKKKITYESHQRLYQDLVTSYEQKKFCDITIKVGSSSNKRIFKANSFILCIRSSYFHKELSSDGMSIDRHVVEIPDMLPREFEVLLRYIYTGVMSFTYVSSLELFDFLLATIKLDCGEVVNYLESQLITNHREWILENFRLVCNTCRQYKNLATLYKFCAEDVMEEILKRFLSDDFENIEEQLLVELLKSEKLKMDAFEVWLRILKWGLAKHPYLDTNPRNWSFKEAEALFETLKDLIPLVQFLQISKSQFFKSVYPYKKIVPDELIDDLVYHHVDPELRPSIFDQIVV